MGELLEHFVNWLAPIITHLLELIGILIITIGSGRAVWLLFKNKFDFHNKEVKINLGEALALSLEFKLGAEIIKTVVIRDLQELIILAFVVVLRIALTLIIHWEVREASEPKIQKQLRKRGFRKISRDE